ncbi:protein kinase-like domain, concanavalin A-like lectin/glucanase domain protein [Tanacetum coccineum]
MEQYLALTLVNQASGVVKPEIGGNVNFEIKTQFMWELREHTFSGNKNNDAHEHVERVLDIVSLFNIPGVSHDAVMLHVFPITLTGAAKRWVDRLSPGTVDSWDHLKKAFIQRYCPPSKTAKQLAEIRIAAIVNKLENLDRDMKKLKENVHAIQVGCQNCREAHLNKDCPLNEEIKSIKEAKYGEFRQTSPFSN